MVGPSFCIYSPASASNSKSPISTVTSAHRVSPRSSCALACPPMHPRSSVGTYCCLRHQSVNSGVSPARMKFPTRACLPLASGKAQPTGKWGKLNLGRLVRIEPDDLLNFRSGADCTHELHAVQGSLDQAARLVRSRRGKCAQKSWSCRAERNSSTLP